VSSGEEHIQSHKKKQHEMYNFGTERQAGSGRESSNRRYKDIIIIRERRFDSGTDEVAVAGDGRVDETRGLDGGMGSRRVWGRRRGSIGSRRAAAGGDHKGFQRPTGALCHGDNHVFFFSLVALGLLPSRP